MTRYASKTEVAPEKSRMEIEQTLRRYGATSFAYATEDNMAMLAFKAKGRFIRFMLPMPDRRSRDFTHTPARGQLRSAKEQETAYDQACRQRWRAMALLIKAKLEAIESGIVSFEDEFLSATVLPSGQTAGQYMIPQLAAAYERNEMPALLPGMGGF